MNKEELIQFLKDNLEIRVETDYDNYDEIYTVTSSLLLDGDIISESSDTFRT